MTNSENIKIEFELLQSTKTTDMAFNLLICYLDEYRNLEEKENKSEVTIEIQNDILEKAKKVLNIMKRGTNNYD